MDKETLDKLRERLENDFKEFEEKYEPDEVSNDYPNTPKDITFWSPRKIYAATLFLDLRGFTAWLDGKTKMVSAIKVLYPYFRLVAQIIKGYSGSIEKFTGDGLMAVLGAPEGDITACKNALECAVDIAAVLDHALNPFLEKNNLDKIQWGMGIEYGLTYVTKVGAHNENGKKYNLLNSVSKAANHASKLEGKAQANQILVGQNLYDKIPDDDELKEELLFAGVWDKIDGKNFYTLKKRWDPNNEKDESEGKAEKFSAYSNQVVQPFSIKTPNRANTSNIEPPPYRRYGQ